MDESYSEVLYVCTAYKKENFGDYH